MCLPAASPPTKEMARIAGSSQMKLTASCVPGQGVGWAKGRAGLGLGLQSRARAGARARAGLRVGLG